MSSTPILGRYQIKTNFLPQPTQTVKLLQTDKAKEFLDHELEECKKLLEIEPDSKWAILTCFKLLIAKRDPESKHQAAILAEKLKVLDPAHSAYYSYLLASK